MIRSLGIWTEHATSNVGVGSPAFGEKRVEEALGQQKNSGSAALARRAAPARHSVAHVRGETQPRGIRVRSCFVPSHVCVSICFVGYCELCTCDPRLGRSSSRDSLNVSCSSHGAKRHGGVTRSPQPSWRFPLVVWPTAFASKCRGVGARVRLC